MNRLLAAACIFAVSSAETYRPGKIPHSARYPQGVTTKPKVFETAKCYGGDYRVIPEDQGGETFSQALVFFKRLYEPAPWGIKWIVSDAEKFTDNIDIFAWTDLDARNIVRVEKWEKAWCHEKDFFTRESDKEPTFITYKRTEIAEWENDEAHSDYTWHLNEFLLRNGLKLKEGEEMFGLERPDGYDDEGEIEIDWVTRGDESGKVAELWDKVQFRFNMRWGGRICQQQMEDLNFLTKTAHLEGMVDALLKMRAGDHAMVHIPSNKGNKGREANLGKGCVVPAYDPFDYEIFMMAVERVPEDIWEAKEIGEEIFIREEYFEVEM